MADRSAIEWTNATWNPVTGCTQVSPGCAHCYALAFAERFRGVPGHPYQQGFDFKLWPSRLDLPMQWRRPRLVFVNSMSDLFQDSVPDDFIASVFSVMRKASWYTFQVLTKRPQRAADLAEKLDWAPNIWMGTSIENRKFIQRADHLRRIPAAVRFISAEPLLGPLEGLDLTGVHWLIAGGESGRRHRPVKIEWLRELRDRCRAEGVRFFFKQWGGLHPKAGGRTLDNEIWSEMPAFGRASGKVLLDSGH